MIYPMEENFERKKMSKGKTMLAALGALAAAEAADLPNPAEAQTIHQYSRQDRAETPDPMIAKLPKETTLFQAAGRGQVNVLDGAKLDPKITHVYLTTRGGTNVIVNKDKIRKDVVIIQEGHGGNVIMGSGAGTVGINGKQIRQQGDGKVTVEDAIPGEHSNQLTPEVKMPDKWPFTDKDSPFKGKGWPFNDK